MKEQLVMVNCIACLAVDLVMFWHEGVKISCMLTSNQLESYPLVFLQFCSQTDYIARSYAAESLAEKVDGFLLSFLKSLVQSLHALNFKQTILHETTKSYWRS